MNNNSQSSQDDEPTSSVESFDLTKRDSEKEKIYHSPIVTGEQSLADKKKKKPAVKFDSKVTSKTLTTS